MNKILIGVNTLLVAAVAVLFFQVSALKEKNTTPESSEKTPEKAPEPKPVETVKQVGNAPPGKIAYVDIDRLNEESLEISDLVADMKRRKNGIEASMENLNEQYQKKVEDFQTSQKAGLATEADMRAKAKEIESIEREAQNKQLQMDNLTMDINDKNAAFQKNVKNFLIKWNAGRFDYIFSYSEAIPSLLIGNTALEVTDEVIKELNNEYKQSKGKK